LAGKGLWWPELTTRAAGVTDEEPKIDPLALGLEWATKITTVALEMVLPAIGGGYLDKRLGTSYWALIGVVVGMVVGMWHLLVMTRTKHVPKKRKHGGSDDNST